jgi:hypothetical protein
MSKLFLSFFNCCFSFSVVRLGVTTTVDDQIVKGFLVLRLQPETRLQFVVCGRGKVLDPTSTSKRFRYVVMIFELQLVHVLRNIFEVCGTD